MEQTIILSEYNLTSLIDIDEDIQLKLSGFHTPVKSGYISK